MLRAVILFVFMFCIKDVAVYGQDNVIPRINSHVDNVHVQTSDPGVILFHTAYKYLGVQENTVEGRKQVLKFLNTVGIKYMTSWCAAFVSSCLDEARLKSPTVRSALAQKFITKQSIKASDVLLGKRKIPQGSLVIWKRGTTINGHIEIVKDWKTKSGNSVGGNTTPPKTLNGKEYDGDGVYLKPRVIQPASYFRIVSFTPVGW